LTTARHAAAHERFKNERDGVEEEWKMVMIGRREETAGEATAGDGYIIGRGRETKRRGTWGRHVGGRWTPTAAA
jgi:hypothetical protein